MRKVLVLNCGSSSIKYRVFDMEGVRVLAAGSVEQLGEPEGLHRHRTHVSGPGGVEKIEDVFRGPIPGHREGIRMINEKLMGGRRRGDDGPLHAVGHRVVHGGEAFREPTRIDEDVLETIRGLVPLAPLHNPANLVGIEVSTAQFPDVPQVAVFDTAFHQTIPPRAYRYAIPKEIYDNHHVRRYGFHGTSCAFVTKAAAARLGRAPEDVNLVILHLGNGASATAVRAGRSVDTSMGLTPLEGLVMGTRSGDIDPAVIFFLGRAARMSRDDIDRILNRESGLKGLCGDNDMRRVVEAAESGNDDARLALDVFTYRIKKYIGAYAATLGRLDAVVFTGGIGENSIVVRERACAGLDSLGIALDGGKNRMRSGDAREIQSSKSRVKLLVVPTNEELEIAQETIECLG